ncbi:hypothetical protein [Vacuolonema iberomarrocanum]|uniref:hypothetical protein n=1 Tax=Vacuolonema iberomarrocanum TaxID=3454632 RepID=UPI003F6E4067
MKISEAQLHIIGSVFFTAYKELSINGPSKYKRFVIVSQGRTGSSLLSDLLDQHPLIRCQSEILNHKVYFPITFIKGMATYYHHHCWGFKVKPAQLRNRQKVDAELFLRQLADEGFTFIQLTRSNLARRTLSALVGYARGSYHKLEQGQPLEPVTIDPAQLLTAINRSIKNQEEENDCMQQVEHLRLVYEDDLFSSEVQVETAQRIFRFLELPDIDAPVQSRFLKVSSANLRDDVENFSELLQHLEQHQMFWAITQLIN